MQDNLRELGVPGFIFLRMRAEDTEQNQKIHNAFREFAEVECKNDYTLALGKLIEYYQADAKTEMLWEAILRVEQRVALIEAQLAVPQPKEEERDTF